MPSVNLKMKRIGEAAAGTVGSWEHGTQVHMIVCWEFNHGFLWFRAKLSLIKV